MQGYGVMYSNDGSVYEGLWVNGQMQGKGSLKWSDGREYQGDF